MRPTLTYLYDPLCGWCYGAGSALATMRASGRIELALQPTGLFSGEGSRAMDDNFAAYAWANDQRIARLTGQVFSERYRQSVLASRTQAFDSGPATVALTAVAQIAPEHEFDALKQIQHGRYVDGLDVTQMDVLADLLRQAGLGEAAARLAHPDDALLAATQARMTNGRQRLRQLGAQGVPTFVQGTGSKSRLLHASAVFSDPEALLRELAPAL